MPITKIMGSPKLHLHTLSNRSINRIAEVAIIQIGAISIIHLFIRNYGKKLELQRLNFKKLEGYMLFLFIKNWSIRNWSYKGRNWRATSLTITTLRN